jgi:tRNA U34 2-thiouridine synthase MnmA/TrmU
MKAVALISGGLDSILAVKIILEQGIEVIGVNFFSPFFGSDAARRCAEDVGISFMSVDISEEYLPILKNPRYGFGKNLNPCIDCHGFMLKKAHKIMKDIGAEFVITGEVLGSRPKSQNRNALRIVEKVSGLNRLLLRPLSAKLLDITIPEERGWVNRELLFDIHGRSRRRQLELAKEFGITQYSQPAGGCLLTDVSFSRRLRDVMRYSEPTVNDIELLKIGRHFRLSDKTKIIVGRCHEENDALLRLLRPGDVWLKTQKYPGPVTVVRGDINEDIIIRAAALCARYSDGKLLDKVDVRFETYPEGNNNIITVHPQDDIELGLVRI